MSYLRGDGVILPMISFFDQAYLWPVGTSMDTVGHNQGFDSHALGPCAIDFSPFVRCRHGCGSAS